MNLDKAKTFKGILGKESPSLFGGYQSRFFQIVEGDIFKGETFHMTYAEKEGKMIKGAIPFEQIGEIQSSSKKEFSFGVGDRKFKLKADNEQLKNEWMQAIKLVKMESERMLKEIEFKKIKDEIQYNKKEKNWKIQNQSKDIVDSLSQQGVSVDKEKLLSEKCIDLKGIKPLLKAINPDLLKTRIKHGFLNKKHKSNFMITQKRWMFLISSRPLTYDSQLNDEDTLDPNSLASTISFDTLYYFSMDDDKDSSTFKGELPLGECSNIYGKEVDKDYFVVIDMNDRIYEFSTEISWERDSWLDALKTSKKTGKDIQLSKTKKPRNMTKLLEEYNNSKTSIDMSINFEAASLIKGFEDIKNIQMLSTLIKKLDTKLIQFVDGCTICNPIPIDILKKYCEKFSSIILNKIQDYWKYLSENLSADQILDLVEMVYKQEEKLLQFGIEDPNFALNGKELVRIFTRKIIMNLQTLIESILKNEREYKALKCEQDDGELLLTNGPVDLFRTFYKTFDMIKKFKIKELHSETFKMFKECILLYLIGVDIVISRADLIIDNEFLIGVCNNSIKLSSQIFDFVDDSKSYSTLSEDEIVNFIGQKSIIKSLNFISETAMSRLVFELCSEDFKKLLKSDFFSVEVTTVVEEINNKLEQFEQYMHFSTRKTYWTEVLKSTIYSYTNCVFNSNNKDKKLNQLIEKIEEDKDKFIESFNMLGKNQLEEEIRILDLIKEFLSADLEMLSFSCSNIKTKAGRFFNLKIAKSLINLRNDWSSDEKKEAETICKEILDNIEENHKNKKNDHDHHDEFFKQLHSDLAKENEEENKQEETNLELEKNLKDINEPLKKERRQTINLDAFLDDLEGGDEEESDKRSSISSANAFKRSETGKGFDEATEIIKEGFLKKKSSKSWQDRYFQLKNKRLYWYNSKDSSIALNYISLKEILKMPFSHKPLKFTLQCDKEYKFECKTQEDTDEWINAIKNEMIKIKNNDKIVQLFQIELKKKVITMQGKVLPAIYSYKATMKQRVIDSMKGENYFVCKKK